MEPASTAVMLALVVGGGRLDVRAKEVRVPSRLESSPAAVKSTVLAGHRILIVLKPDWPGDDCATLIPLAIERLCRFRNRTSGLATTDAVVHDQVTQRSPRTGGVV